MTHLRRLSAVGSALLVALSLAGCGAPSESSPSPTAEVTTVAPAIQAGSITDIDDGIAWARSLDGTVTAAELSTGINRIGGLVPDLDIWFADNNEIGGALIKLNADVLRDPDAAGEKVDDLNAIIDKLEASIAKGDQP